MLQSGIATGYYDPMHRNFARIRGLGFIFWQTRHEFVHMLLGLVWAWFLRELWGEMNLWWVVLAVFGSLLPDLDHFIYFFTYGRYDAYSVAIRNLVREHEWRNLFEFIRIGHKSVTTLYTHNVYFMGILFFASVGAFVSSWQSGVVLLGAMVIHYVFDIIDDVFVLGALNPNWKRWGRGRRKMMSSIRSRGTVDTSSGT